MALSGKPETWQKSPGKSRGIAWKDKDVEELIELMKEETIIFSLENATKVFKCNCKTKVTFSMWQILHTETSISLQDLLRVPCKAVERKVDFRIFCWKTCGLLMRRNSKNFSSSVLAACALGKNRVRWPRC